MSRNLFAYSMYYLQIFINFCYVFRNFLILLEADYSG